jgi:hypothetical protein
MMASLLSLPSEIIYNIFDCLQPVDEYRFGNEDSDPENGWRERHYYRTLAALARTCKLLQPIATRSLLTRYIAPYIKPITAITRRLGNDPEVRQVLRHIRVLAYDPQGPNPNYEGRTRDEIQENLCDLLVLDRPDVGPLLGWDPSQIELAVLIAQAPNIETLRMEEDHNTKVGPNQLVPIWLVPIVEAARSLTSNPNAQIPYARLRTLKINMQRYCSPDIAYLFDLPALRRLHMDGIALQPISLSKAEPLPWPVATATSGVRELELTNVETPAHIVTHMLNSCKALLEFKCRRVWKSTWEDHHMVVQTSKDCRAWCVDVCAAIERHSPSLEVLELEPMDSFLRHDHEFQYEPLDLFVRLEVLEELTVPWMLLMGRPSAKKLRKVKYPWEGYPRMLDVLPPNLKKVSLTLTPWTAPKVTEASFTDAGLSGDQCLLKFIYITYDTMDWEKPLPLPFFEIQDTLQHRGVAFDYVLRDVFGDNQEDGGLLEGELETVAEELALYGAKGVEMARHFSQAPHDLPRRVEEFLDSDGSNSDETLGGSGDEVATEDV